MNKITVVLYTDNEYEMQKVTIAGENIYEGNFWDFYPGCHGIPNLFDKDSIDFEESVLGNVKKNWDGADELCSELVRVLTDKNYEVEFLQEEYTYE